MYCKNCGKELREKALSCDYCSFTRGNGAGYCPNCGRRVPYQTEKCEYCGGTVYSLYHEKSRHRIVATLMAFFLGFTGLHNFYLGYFKKGLFQLIATVALLALSVGALAIIIWGWAWVEGINIARGETRVDAHGRFLKG